MFEEQITELMENPNPGRSEWYSRDLKHLTIDLITEPLNENDLVKQINSAGVWQRFGFLCEITAEAAKSRGLSDAASKLSDLAKLVYHSPVEWQYLNPHLPDFAKRIISSSDQTEVNKKWKIYDPTTPQEIAEWVDLYILEENASKT